MHLSVTQPFTYPTALSEIPLFRGVPARELERLATLLHEKVFPADEPGEGVYVILYGTSKEFTDVEHELPFVSSSSRAWAVRSEPTRSGQPTACSS